jgi:hypothetical protein
MRRVTLITLILPAGLGHACERKPDAIQSPGANAIPLCTILKNPESYDGKKITATATVTGSQSAKYVYSGKSCDDGNMNTTFVRLETGGIQHSGSREIEGSPQENKEFDLEVTGIFDSGYKEGFKGLAFRIKASEIRQISAIRIRRPFSVT